MITAANEPTAKDIVLRVCPRPHADAVIRRWHYSGKTVPNSQVSVGCYLSGVLHGAMQFGPPTDRGKVLGLVAGTPWKGAIELNRMAFGPALPRNSESRALAVAMRLLRQHAPSVQWVLSFADASQCGDGTIYRAAGFVLTGIRRNTSTWVHPTLPPINRMTVTTPSGARRNGGSASMDKWVAMGYQPAPGYQLRYIYFLDPDARQRLTVPELPYAAIRAAGATMYRGVPGGSGQRAAQP